MTRPSPFRQSDVERLLRAAKAVGYPYPTVDKLPDGRLRLLTEPKATEQPAADPFAEWEKTQSGGRAA